MTERTRLSAAILLTASLMLAACGDDGKDANLGSLDAKLTENSTDPALREAIEAPIASDPDLTGEANRDAVRPVDRPLNGAVPARLSPRDAKELALKLAGGTLLEAPAASRSVTSTREPATLGGLAEQQAGSHGSKCPSPRIVYDAQWTTRMPPAFPVYPGAAIREAAGADGRGACALRAVSFSTPSSAKDVMDFYHSMAKRAGYSSEHIEQNGADVLGGARAKDDGAYHIVLRPAPDGGTDVELIANGGR